MNRPTLRFLLGCLALLALISPLCAQSPGATAANTAAYDLYSGGDYKGAAAAYEALLKNYPTDAVIPGAQVQLAFCYYFLGQYDQALTTINKATSLPVLPPDLKQVADALVPEIYMAKAGAMPATDSKRKAAYEEAIKQITAYLAKYPQAQDAESMVYYRGIAQFQIQKYDEAQKDFELNLQKFPQSATIATSKNLLALTLATVGNLELAKGESADKTKAFANYKRATDLLREIISNKNDIALINEANFQLGEILVNQASASPEADRPPLYKEALAAFRDVAPKTQIIEWQTDKVKAFPSRRKEALKANNGALLKQLDKENERELKKLAELQGKEDQTATALLKMGEIFFQQQQFNEARVVLNHVLPALTLPDDQKRALYFTTMTYGIQKVEDKAAAGYQNFQSKYKGDPLGDNLPIVTGDMYLGLGKPNDAIRIYDEALALYPNGRFANQAVLQKAVAQLQLKNFADAMKTFQSILAKNPPPELGVIAQYGLAGIYKDSPQPKWDDAIAAYKTVKEKYPGTPQAIDSDYWIAVCTQQKGDNAASIPLLDAFVKAYPKNPLTPIALYAKGTAQIAVQQKDAGMATLAQVAKEYPASLPAPFTYFIRAQLLGADGKADAVIALMEDFIKAYPKDDKVFSAYDTIGQTAISAGKPDVAIAAYTKFSTDYPASPQAAEALYKVADLQRSGAEALGRYAALNADERAKWEPLVKGSIATIEQMIKRYPEDPAMALAFQTLLQDQRLLLGAELTKPADVEKYFQSLADAAPSPAAKSKILFTLAAYVATQDKARAFTIMSGAYKPDIAFSPQDLDSYGEALIEQKKLDDAAAVFEKLATNYPVPSGMQPGQASTIVQEAQATALYGKGSVAQAKGQTAEAGKYFEQLKALYPWSPKVLEANFGIAQSYVQQNKLDDAILLLTAIIRAPTASAELRANSMLLGGEIMAKKFAASTTQKDKDDYLGAAIDYYLKISTFYASVPSASAEGLWKGAQLLEQQATVSAPSTKDPAKFTATQLAKAKGFYQQLIKDYPNSEYVSKAQERLNALGGK